MKFLSLRRARVRTILCFMFSIILLPSMVGMSFITPTFSDSPIFADVTGDGVVDVTDYVAFIVAYGSTPEDPNWNPSVDLIHDGVVDITDLVALVQKVAPLEQENIFFQYGAESGGLKPPWSQVGVSPGGTYCSHSADPSGVWVSSTNARTGTKSMYCYIHPPPQDNPCRRITNRYYGPGISDEYYFSWWVYFPSSSWDNEDGSGWGTCLGGIQLYWGPPSETWKWTMAFRFFVSPKGNRRFFLRYGWDYTTEGGYCGTYVDKYWYSNFYLRSGLMDQWIHFQVYMKYRDDGTGVVRGWINDVLVGEMTGLTMDPRAYPQWSSKGCEFGSGSIPWLEAELYEARGSSSHYIWVDDCVGAYQKVPEDYGVVYP